MSEMSKKAREDAKAKVRRLTDRGDEKVDASGWNDHDYAFQADKKQGNRPISKQNLACGGKAAIQHGGRRARAMGGPMAAPTGAMASNAGQPLVAAVQEPPANRFSFAAQNSPMLGAAGMKKGGGIHIKKSHEGLLHKELGVSEGKKIPVKKIEKAAHSSNPAERKRAVFAENAKKWHHADGGKVAKASGGGIEAMLGTRPKGGREAHSEGGKAGKGKMNVNIIIAQKPEHPPMPPAGGAPMPPPHPMPPPGAVPPAAMGPQGAPAGPMPGGPNMPPPSMGGDRKSVV